MPDYPYEGQLIADPVSFQRAVSAQVTVYDAADATNTTPLALKDASGLPTANPLTSSSDAFVKPIYAPSQDIKYVGAGLTVFVSSAKGMRDAAEGAAAAAQASANAASQSASAALATAEVNGSGRLILTKASGATVDAGSVIGTQGVPGPPGQNGSNVLPTDDAIESAILTNGTKTKAALSSTIATLNAGAYGAVGDGVADDTAALQSAIDAAYASNKKLFIPSGTYKLTNHLLVRSGQDVGGVRGKTTLKQVTPGKAVMASHNYMGGNPGPSGHCSIHDLVIQGEPTSPTSHGLIFRDYLSYLERLIISSCGGNGLHMTYLNSSGAAYGGSSMVDNRITEVDARDCKGYGLFLGEMDNNKFTDAYLQHIYVAAGVGSPGDIYVGSAGGWKFLDVHTYGQTVPVAVEINNLNHTTVIGFYIEGNWTDVGLKLGRVQQSVTVDDLSVKCSSAIAGGTAVFPASRSSAVTQASILFGTVSIAQDIAVAVNAFKKDTSTIICRVGALMLDGANQALITKFAGTSGGTIIHASDIRMDAQLRDSVNKNTLLVGGTRLALSSISSWADSGAKVVTVPLPLLTNFAVLSGTLKVVSVRNYNGTVGARWRADVIITSKAAGDPWYVYVADVLAATGFDVAPVVTIDKATQMLTVSFTPTAADGKGRVSLAFEYE